MDDELEVESWVEEWREKIFVVKHIVKKGNEIIVEGTEIRACVVKDEKSSRGIRAEPMPSDVVSKFV